MKLRYKSINQNLENKETEITFVVVDELESLLKWIKTKVYFELDIWINKRSKEANRYFWRLVREISRKMNTSNDEVYLFMIERYGVFEVKPVPNDEEYMQWLKDKWRLVIDMGDCEINDTTMRKVKCFYGSSTYNIQEMWQLINGIVSECEHLQIPTKNQKELEKMCNDWRP